MKVIGARTLKGAVNQRYQLFTPTKSNDGRHCHRTSSPNQNVGKREPKQVTITMLWHVAKGKRFSVTDQYYPFC